MIFLQMLHLYNYEDQKNRELHPTPPETYFLFPKFLMSSTPLPYTLVFMLFECDR